jgi:hypothetical protein
MLAPDSAPLNGNAFFRTEIITTDGYVFPLGNNGASSNDPVIIAVNSRPAELGRRQLRWWHSLLPNWAKHIHTADYKPGVGDVLTVRTSDGDAIIEIAAVRNGFNWVDIVWEEDVEE